MENNQYQDPKDDQITNYDTAVTNKDGNNNLEKGELPTDQTKPDDKRVPTVTPDNDNGDPTPPKKEENTFSKGQGPKSENL